jgi:ubiquinone/menaquinone biosynthesis C-methylase UbiE
MKTKYAAFILVAILGFLLQETCLSQVPYVPTPESIVNEMLNVAKVTSSDVVYDLGCGDGRIVVIAAKKFGARGVGIDNNPARIRDSWANAKRNGLTYQVNFIEQDLFETNLRDATVVTLYLLTNVNLKLRPKLFQELKPGTRVVSNSFSMDNWEPDSLIDIEGRNLYYWKIPANASGVWDVEAVGNEVKNKYTLYLDRYSRNLKDHLKSEVRNTICSHLKLMEIC